MSLRGDHELLQLSLGGHSGKQLASVFIEVDHVEHDSAGLFAIWQLRDKGELGRSHRLVVADSGRVGLRVLAECVASVKDATDRAHGVVSVVHALVLQIVGDPAAVHEDSLLLAASIEVSVEGSDDVDAFLAVADLLDLDLAGVVEDATHLDGLHGPIGLKLIQVGLLCSPDELTLVGRSDVLGLL
eukprot:CAMPEP_0185570410 /NCGR_PEP_ID=MMETSP0434-20130131/2734_1 /TAXON_ID=626734 ORGANISM="Favella taraikaensis, Strain Fe Narragansett Bay" /NCGR_SAMPLE_ID=MMETSP0434 /ASSEMBLY_ACC=CAM_ASM_000379 /LENGTH=185 /DNA_ID=CAMNT_0028185525 /DNA_START=197 /DNA_END=754 /DNA_ORIENTATION=-